MINLRKNETGLVSITVTVILMLVISITVLSFAQVIRREQRQALDNQLNSQAYYAAESGINDLRQYIKDHYATQVPPEKKVCGPTAEYPLTGSVDANTKTTYSCLLVTGSPKSLKYDLSPSAPSKVFPIDATPNSISSVELSWTPSVANNPLNGCPTTVSTVLPPATSWPCTGYGILRIDMVPVNALNRAAMMAGTFTAFITPTANAATNATVSYVGAGLNVYGGSANQEARPAAYCSVTSCKITITNLAASTGYFARVSTIYRDTTLNVVAKNSLNQELGLTGAQVMLDATGRANDVLRRIQVRVPLVNDGVHADYGIQSTDSLCKQFNAFPSYGVNIAGC
jgi:hypothetical protein